MVTIIIPIYNQIKYINKSITSSLNQTYKDIEIILVDDGSTDGSSEVCDDYSKYDKRIKVIHKENGGLSSARNAGLDIAKGEYITFLDSDDYLSKDYIMDSVRMCKKYNADIAILNMRYIAENVNDEIMNESDGNIDVFTAEQAIENSLYQINFSCCAPGKLYKFDILKNIRFPVDKLSEDLAVCHRILNQSKKVVYMNKNGYYYRQQSESIMHVFNYKRLDAMQWVKEIEGFCDLNYPSIINAAKCRTFNVAVHLLLDIQSSEEKKEEYNSILWKEIKRTRVDVLKSKKARFREKAAAILSYGGLKILILAWNSRFAIKQG